MIFTNHKQHQAQQPSAAPRELNLDELRAVAGGIVVQKTRPDPSVYDPSVYPVVQNEW